MQTLFELVGTGGPFSPGGAASSEIDKRTAEARVRGNDDPRRKEDFSRLIEMISSDVAIAPCYDKIKCLWLQAWDASLNLAAYSPGGADRFNDVRGWLWRQVSLTKLFLFVYSRIHYRSEAPHYRVNA